MKNPPKIGAKDIIDLLKIKHSEDIFIPECKSGPTWGGSHLRLDGWAMKKSYSSPLTTGYEVKVSRSDFINDTKLHEYLSLCNALYIVCPAGLIDKTEVPEDCGLMSVSKTGTRIYTKKKAPYREVETPINLYKYILMSRATIVESYHRTFDKKRYMEDYADRKEKAKHAGEYLGRRLRERIEAEIDDVKRENEKLIDQNQTLEEIKVLLGRMGIGLNDWGLKRKFERQIKELEAIIPDDLERGIRCLAERLTDTVREIDELKNKAIAPDATNKPKEE